MDEAKQAPQALAPTPNQSSGEQAVKEGDANKASAIDAVAKTREDLGHVAVEGPVFDASGVYLTPEERQAERAHVQLHGHGSNETATGR